MRQHGKQKLLCIALLMSWSTSIFAGQWEMRPSLQLGEIYTDNIALAPPGKEKTEFVTQINPGFSIHGKGGRIKLDLAYVLQNYIYPTDGNRNSSISRLAANGNAELVKNIFFVDARSSISQQIINATGRVALDNLNAGNYANVYTYGLSPYVKLRFATYAVGELRFSEDRVENQTNNISNADSQQYTAHLNNGIGSGRLRWNAGYLKHDLDQKSYGVSHYQSANANILYQVSRAWSLMIHSGYEDNKLARINNPHNGSFWSAGLEWSPSPRFAVSGTKGENNWDANLSLNPNERTSMHIGYQNRNIGLIRGPSWNVILSHRTRRTTWQGSYSEENTTVQSLQLSNQQFFHLIDSQGNLIVDPNTGLPVVVVRNVFSLTDQNFTRKRGQLAVTMNTGKSEIVLSVFNEQRIYSVSNNNSEDVVGPSFSWIWHFAPRTRSMIGGGWQHRNPAYTDQHEDLWNGSIGLIHTVSQHINTSLIYSHLQRNTYLNGGDYGENRLSLQLNMRF